MRVYLSDRGADYHWDHLWFYLDLTDKMNKVGHTGVACGRCGAWLTSEPSLLIETIREQEERLPCTQGWKKDMKALSSMFESKL